MVTVLLLQLISTFALAELSTAQIHGPCAKIEKQAAALSAWTLRVEDRIVDPAKAVSSTVEGCLLNARLLLPSRAEKVVDRYARFRGPNCVNTALTLNESLNFHGEDSFRLVHFEEAALWFRSSYCQVLKPDEAMSPGDLWWIRRYDASATSEDYQGSPIQGDTRLFRAITKQGGWDDQERDVHVFTHLTDDLSFSKDSYDTVDGYRLVEPQIIFKTFKSAPRCTGVNPSAVPSGCPIRTYRVRCETNPFSENLLKQSSTLAALAQNLSDIQSELSQILLSGASKDEYQRLSLRVLPTLKKIQTQSRNSISAVSTAKLRTAFTLILAATHSLEFQLTGMNK